MKDLFTLFLAPKNTTVDDNDIPNARFVTQTGPLNAHVLLKSVNLV